MEKYGYLEAIPGDQIDNRVFGYVDLINSLKDVQVLLRVNQTGRLDDETMDAIRRPRCGVKDDVKQQHINSLDEAAVRVRRYALKWNKWNKKLLTYRLLNYPSNCDLTKDQVDDAIHRAFKRYGDISRLRFKAVKGDEYADIYMKFMTGMHGDGYPFDGPNGTVAHAYLPDGRYGDFDGDVHFDDSEDFTHEEYKGYNLYQVALHEIGHSLGLEHSWVEGAVMIPDYAGYNPEYTLGYDDIRAIQLLYGSGVKSSSDKQNSDAECNRAFDAAIMIDGELHIFKNRLYWRTARLSKLLSPIEGESIRKRFPKLPRYIDAGYQRPQDGKIVFFKGSQYWVYDNDTLDANYPRPVSELGLPDKIDAAMMLKYYNKTYFFKNDQVWRYDEFNETMDHGYPSDTEVVWEGIPPPVHAAFDFNDGYTYFVQFKKYFRYNNLHRNADPGFPRYFGQDFIGCE
ncbi:collagenase 3-like [Amphiura filiformis]|uniref:collagenase 3-like n=1 Tax=Amphiura filiformis TaxID=82378 RepID=UPI003B20DF3E